IRRQRQMCIRDRRDNAAASNSASNWRKAVFAAFCLVFTLTITDFGVPVVAVSYTHRGLAGCG
ncbi:hypothetical protein QN403_28365, partial [Pseudomonas sp. RTS2]|uniref:hypothetical protein n=1 Tax=Pseudomonas sp. RTS2 TaxID=3048642 RepID=UPI002B23A86C